MKLRKACANHSAQHPCKNPPSAGHIFCTDCRIANGGYDNRSIQNATRSFDRLDRFYVWGNRGKRLG